MDVKEPLSRKDPRSPPKLLSWLLLHTYIHRYILTIRIFLIGGEVKAAPVHRSHTPRHLCQVLSQPAYANPSAQSTAGIPCVVHNAYRTASCRARAGQGPTSRARSRVVEDLPRDREGEREDLRDEMTK